MSEIKKQIKNLPISPMPSIIVPLSAQGGEANVPHSPVVGELETIEGWRVWRPGYILKPGEMKSFNRKIKRHVITGGTK